MSVADVSELPQNNQSTINGNNENYRKAFKPPKREGWNGRKTKKPIIPKANIVRNRSYAKNLNDDEKSIRLFDK